MEIVGVVGDMRNQGVGVPTAPEIFVPMHQQTVNNQLDDMRALVARDLADAQVQASRRIAGSPPRTTPRSKPQTWPSRAPGTASLRSHIGRGAGPVRL
jgi:hypothetical protein